MNFFTLVDSVATLDIQNLLLINLCANFLVPDPVRLPTVHICQSQAIYSISYSRCVYRVGLFCLFFACLFSLIHLFTFPFFC